MLDHVSITVSDIGAAERLDTRVLLRDAAGAGDHAAERVRAGTVQLPLSGVAGFVPGGVSFADGSERPYDAVVLATGFAAALGPLGSLVERDAKGFPRRLDRVTSADQPSLYFVGSNYDATGGLANIRRDSLLVAERIARGN